MMQKHCSPGSSWNRTIRRVRQHRQLTAEDNCIQTIQKYNGLDKYSLVSIVEIFLIWVSALLIAVEVNTLNI